MKKTPTEMQTRPQFAACPSFFHLGWSSFQPGSCRDALKLPLPPPLHPGVGRASQTPRRGMLGERGTARVDPEGNGQHKRGGNRHELAGGNFALI